jgi:hypothetical protein
MEDIKMDVLARFRGAPAAEAAAQDLVTAGYPLGDIGIVWHAASGDAQLSVRTEEARRAHEILRRHRPLDLTQQAVRLRAA